MNPDLTFALELADLADAISMGRFGAADLSVSVKEDFTPVTDADHKVERELRRRIAEVRPGQTVLGEEAGDGGCGSGAATRWVLDPIDGTKNFMRGVPVWATLIGLQRDGRGVVGVVSAPALGRRWWAARGEGAWADGRRLAVSEVSQLDQAFLSYDSVSGFDECGLTEAFLGLARRCGRTRAYGDFWSHMLVAEGAIDIAVEPQVALWDVVAVQVVVEEAGGRFSDLKGSARPDGGSAVSTNAALHDEVLAALLR